ncbi:hypothetical protein NPIL_408441 [Nephila pilipes]|uniref:Uncharacterized protein n=1 Tax=Nephila pilipes TaxID=299642 RepID=A0A8X6Q5K1_NEPPI|nr:hypothetical protein NPIL_408441 [Nephila pilipes]
MHRNGFKRRYEYKTHEFLHIRHQTPTLKVNVNSSIIPVQKRNCSQNTTIRYCSQNHNDNENVKKEKEMQMFKSTECASVIIEADQKRDEETSGTKRFIQIESM